MAKNPGKKFEEDFVSSIPERCDVTRLKDAGGWSNATNLRFTIKNPCDFIIFSADSGAMHKLELKSFLGKSMPYSNIKPKEDAQEKFVEGLVQSQRKGVSAAFILNFRSINETYRVSAANMQEYMLVSGRKSFPLKEARRVGRRIEQTLKRIRFRYDLEWL